MKLNSTDKKVMKDTRKYGFTWVNGAARTVMAGQRSINKLVKMGWLYELKSEFGTEYKLTDVGLDATEYPIINGLN